MTLENRMNRLDLIQRQGVLSVLLRQDRLKGLPNLTYVTKSLFPLEQRSWSTKLTLACAWYQG